ncbi:hypothetical protein V1318_07535 [Lysobacter sp. CCNWLW3]|uniref:hypothetical protein n=1 Tax=unclassified Lysobacter TaxID=2635362 RepID=UPI002FD6ABD9
MSPVVFFLCIALGALLLAALFGLAWRRRARPVLLVAAVAWLAYALYEAAVQLYSPGAALRADLLLIWPLLVLIAVYALWRARRARP